MAARRESLVSDSGQWSGNLGFLCSERPRCLYGFQKEPLLRWSQKVSGCRWSFPGGDLQLEGCPATPRLLPEAPGSSSWWNPGGNRCHFLAEVMCFAQCFFSGLSPGCRKSSRGCLGSQHLDHLVKSVPTRQEHSPPCDPEISLYCVQLILNWGSVC